MDHPPIPPILVIFGITGDLSKRKLLPAIYHLFSQNLLPEGIKIVGISRHEINTDELLGSVELCVLEKDNVCDPEGIKGLREALSGFKLDPTEQSDFANLKTYLDELDGGEHRDHIFYMSIPPIAYAPIVESLAGHGMNDHRSRILVEKPFGYDIESAEQLISLINTHYKEQQVYRIDHYLAKETAQNLLTFRLHNPIFKHIWDSEHIERVHIIAAEALGVENRADFYDNTGALRDLIQSHLLQLLALTLMDVPHTMSSREIHMSKQYFLEQLLPAKPEHAIRAQYEGYREAVGNPKSNTETYAKISMHHGAERWQGVEMILETGKSLPEKVTSIKVDFRSEDPNKTNSLTFKIQPDEGISLDLVVKKPGFDNQEMQHTALDFKYDDVFKDNQHIDAYERVLMDSIRADQALFASANEVLATWRAVQPILNEWNHNSEGLGTYQPGTFPEPPAPKE